MHCSTANIGIFAETRFKIEYNPQLYQSLSLSLIRDVVATFQQLVEFLETRARSLEMVLASSSLSTSTQAAHQFSKAASKTTTSVLHAIGDQCKLQSYSDDSTATFLSPVHCNGNHKIYVCLFSKIKCCVIFTLIKKHNACLNCLSKLHFLAKCSNLVTCNTYRRRHHTLLHGSQNDDRTKDESSAHASIQQGYPLVKLSTTNVSNAILAPPFNTNADSLHPSCVASSNWLL